MYNLENCLFVWPFIIQSRRGKVVEVWESLYMILLHRSRKIFREFSFLGLPRFSLNFLSCFPTHDPNKSPILNKSCRVKFSMTRKAKSHPNLYLVGKAGTKQGKINKKEKFHTVYFVSKKRKSGINYTYRPTHFPIVCNCWMSRRIPLKQTGLQFLKH